MKFCVKVYVCDVEADSYEEAKEKASERLYALAGCNDGSEILANAEPELFLNEEAE